MFPSTGGSSQPVTAASAIVLSKTGRSAEAERAYRRAVELQEALVAEFPKVPDYPGSFTASDNNTGPYAPRITRGARSQLRQPRNLLSAKGRLVEAERAYLPDPGASRALVAEFPKVPEYARRSQPVTTTLETCSATREGRRRRSSPIAGPWSFMKPPWPSFPRSPSTGNSSPSVTATWDSCSKARES